MKDKLFLTSLMVAFLLAGVASTVVAQGVSPEDSLNKGELGDDAGKISRWFSEQLGFMSSPRGFSKRA